MQPTPIPCTISCTLRSHFKHSSLFSHSDIVLLILPRSRRSVVLPSTSTTTVRGRCRRRRSNASARRLWILRHDVLEAGPQRFDGAELVPDGDDLLEVPIEFV